MTWQPIETAPKDGTVVDLWVVDKNGDGDRELDFYWSVQEGRWTSDTEDFFSGRSLLCWGENDVRITHWQPITAPPAEARG